MTALTANSPKFTARAYTCAYNRKRQHFRLLNTNGLQDFCSAGGGTRTHTGHRSQRIFVPPQLSLLGAWSGLSLHRVRSDVGAARQVSAPSQCRAWLRVTRQKASLTLSSSTRGVSAPALTSASPLRLPIPPPRQGGTPCTSIPWGVVRSRHHDAPVERSPGTCALHALSPLIRCHIR